MTAFAVCKSAKEKKQVLMNTIVGNQCLSILSIVADIALFYTSALIYSSRSLSSYSSKHGFHLYFEISH